MNYTQAQYEHMRETVLNALMEAELHNGRIIKRVTSEAHLHALHSELETKLVECIEICARIENAYG